jgi:hypothetical protein
MALIGIQEEVRNLFRAANQSSLGGEPVNISGQRLTIENLEKLKKGILMHTAYQSHAGADAILSRAEHYCPIETTALVNTGTVRNSDAMAVPKIEGIEPNVGGSISTFEFTQKQRTMWWVTFGDTSVEYAAAIHENEGGKFSINTGINPNARDHFLYYAYLEHEPYISKRIVDRIHSQIVAAGVTAALIKAQTEAAAKAFGRGLSAGTGLPRLVKGAK